MSIWDSMLRARFRMRQPFTLTPAGRRAEERYRALIVASRVKPGRGPFDVARLAWASSMGLEPDDGVYLGELSTGSVTVAELAEALEICGLSRLDVMHALHRLLDAGLVDAGPRA